MNLKIFSKPFFTNYIVHPRSDDLSKQDKRKALISSIAIGIFTLGICHAISAITFHGKRVKIPAKPQDFHEAKPLGFLKMETLTDRDNYKIACDLPFEQHAKKMQILRDLAKKDFAPALYSLGIVYVADKEKYRAEGMGYLKRAADQGHIDACKELCLRLSLDSPVQKDVIREKAQVVFNANHLVRIWDPHRHGSPKVKNMEELEHYLENL